MYSRKFDILYDEYKKKEKKTKRRQRWKEKTLTKRNTLAVESFLDQILVKNKTRGLCNSSRRRRENGRGRERYREKGIIVKEGPRTVGEQLDLYSCRNAPNGAGCKRKRDRERDKEAY